MYYRQMPLDKKKITPYNSLIMAMPFQGQRQRLRLAAQGVVSEVRDTLTGHQVLLPPTEVNVKGRGPLEISAARNGLHVDVFTRPLKGHDLYGRGGIGQPAHEVRDRRIWFGAIDLGNPNATLERIVDPRTRFIPEEKGHPVVLAAKELASSGRVEA